MRPFLFLFAVAFTASAAHAQSARWEPAASGDPAEIQLVFEDCRPEGDPQLPRVDGITFTFAGRSEQTSIVNFSMTRSTIFTYRARSTRSGPISIPAFTVKTDKGDIRVAAFTGGATRSAADANVSSRIEPANATVWAGQVFPLTYVLDVSRRSFNQLGTNIEWDAAPLVVEEWSKFEPTETTANGDVRLLITAKTRGYAKSPGPIALNAANQLVNLQSGSIGFGLFQTPRIEQLAVASNQPTLVVRPLPPAPAGFSGAVGEFKLTSKVVPTNAGVGEPITWTLELSGTGNWPDIAGLPQRAVSKDFSVVQPQAKRTPEEGKLFDVTLSEDVVLVPVRPGNYTLGPVNFVYFDPTSGTYKTITAPRTQVTVTAAAAPSIPPVQTGAPQTQDTSAPVAEPKLPAPPSAPAAIPREPLPGSKTVMAPLRPKTLAWLAAAPFAALPLLWLVLAVQRARATDPLRPQREARHRLTATLAQLKNSQPSTLNPQLLLQWQHDTAILWDIPHAAPPAAALNDPAWSQLWIESDRALYSANGELPSDWVSRAEAAFNSKRLPGFSPLRLFLPRNLFPFVALLTVAALLPTLIRAAETPNSELRSPISANSPAASSYAAGEFVEAGKLWGEAVARDPRDAIARHNLSLALSQQDRWTEAAAQASAAFVQNPASDATRWQLALASEKSGYLAAPLAPFLASEPLQSITRLASPATWQILLIGSTTLIAAALGVLIWGAYRERSRARLVLALSALTIGVISFASAAGSVWAYQSTAHPDAVLTWRAGTLRSIPTEADNTQKTSTLPPGSIALADENLSFLGWLHLSFDNGQTGWVRKEEVVPLWK